MEMSIFQSDELKLLFDRLKMNAIAGAKDKNFSAYPMRCSLQTANCLPVQTLICSRRTAYTLKDNSLNNLLRSVKSPSHYCYERKLTARTRVFCFKKAPILLVLEENILKLTIVNDIHIQNYELALIFS